MRYDTPEGIVGNALNTVQARIDRGAVSMDDSGIIVYGWTIAYLMVLLTRINPEVADAAAKDLAEAWDDGSHIHEMVWEWRDDITNGRIVDFADTVRRVVDAGRGEGS